MALLNLTVSFSTLTETWWSIDDSGKLICRTNRPSEAEKFLLQQQGDKYAIFSTSRNRYLSRVNYGNTDYIEATKTKIDPHCLFLATPLEGQASIACGWKADNGGYMKVGATGFVMPNSEFPNDPQSTFLVTSAAIWVPPQP